MAQETGFLFWVHGIYDVVIVNGFIRHALGNPYSQDTDTHQYTYIGFAMPDYSD